MEPPQVRWDAFEVGDDVVGRQRPPQRSSDVLRQRTVAPAEQERSEQPTLAEPVDRDDHVDVLDEGAQSGGLGRPDQGGRQVLAHAVGLHDRVERGVAPPGSFRGDHVGHHLERPTVVRHESEAPAQLDDLLDARCGEEIREGRHRTILAARIGSRRHLPLRWAS